MAKTLVNPNDLGGALQDLLDRVTDLEQAGGSIPVGAIIFSPSKVPWDGFLLCDGSVFSQARYGRLAIFLQSTTLPTTQSALVACFGAGGTFGTVLQRQQNIASAATLFSVTLAAMIKY